MALNLFGGGRGAGRSNQPKNVVEFKAGKMSLKAGNMVHPDKRKGLVYIYQSEDGLTHFCWKDRTSGVIEDDLIIFPEDAVFSKVKQCKDDSRVFLLKFKNSARKMFYWMQEPKVDGDGDLASKVNDAINNPGGSGSSRAGGGSSSSTPTASEQEMQQLLQSMSPTQLMQLLNGMNVHDLEGASSLLSSIGLPIGGGSTTGESKNGGGSAAVANSAASGASNNASSTKKEDSKAANSSAKPAVQLQDLQKILSGMQTPSSVDLAAGVNSEFIKRITSCPTTVQKLTPLLPKFGFSGSSEAKEASDSQDVADTLISPAFQHALSSFCSAFPSGQLGPLIEQFQFGTDAVQAAQTGNLEAFLNAIQKEADSKATEPAEKPEEDMNVD